MIPYRTLLKIHRFFLNAYMSKNSIMSTIFLQHKNTPPYKISCANWVIYKKQSLICHIYLLITYNKLQQTHCHMNYQSLSHHLNLFTPNHILLTYKANYLYNNNVPNGKITQIFLMHASLPLKKSKMTIMK